MKTPTHPCPVHRNFLALACTAALCVVGGKTHAQTASPAAAPMAPQPTLIAATATLVEGTAFVTRNDGRQGILARGSSLAVGDVLSTTRNSTVRLRFTDGGETAIRPDSRISVQAYTYVHDVPATDSLVLSLLKGGLRAITGSIGKRGNIDAYRLNMSTATVGIRGTDYTARVCNNDCTDLAISSNVTTNVPINSGPPVIAKVVQSQGSVRVERGTRQIDVPTGGPLYAADKVSTVAGGYAVLAFKDDTRLTLNSGTQIALAQFNYDIKTPAKSSMLLQLLAGGLRVATGLIGKAAPTQVKFQTGTATIGIRGTLFDVTCGKADASDNPPAADLSDIACDQSLFAITRGGEITLAGSDGREVALPAGQSGVVPGAGGSAKALSNAPGYFGTLTTPAPEAITVNLEQLFGSAPPAEATPGVYLMVRDGKVVLSQSGQSGQSLSLDAGESGFAGPTSSPALLAATPLLLERDPSLSNRVFNFNACRP
jgi:hypothetical protein